jgi:universal stress protein A
VRADAAGGAGPARNPEGRASYAADLGARSTPVVLPVASEVFGQAHRYGIGRHRIGTSHAPCIVMTYKKILCPVDFSDSAQEALRVAVDLARAPQAKLVIVHVWQPLSWTMDYGMQQLPNDAQAVAQRAEETKLAAWTAEAQKLGATEVTSLFLKGTPWDQIVSAASEERADLIVMGTQGRTGFQRALIGSVAERVVRHAPCAVLVARARPSGR